MGSFSHRLIKPELLEDPELDARSHRSALDELNRLQRWTGAAESIFRSLKKFSREVPPDRPLRVLDLGCADGWMVAQCLRMAKRHWMPIHLIGMDISHRSVEWARQRMQREGFDADFIQGDALVSPLPAPVDVVVMSLFLHHFDDARIVDLLRRIHRIQPAHLIIHDLERGRWNARLVNLAVRAFTRSSIVRIDAERSVRAALTRQEAQRMLSQCGFQSTHCRSAWPCRFKIEASCWASIPVRDREPANSLMPNVAVAGVVLHKHCMHWDDAASQSVPS